MLAMTREQREIVERMPQAAGKPVYTLREYAGEEDGDIADPASRDESFFRDTCAIIKQALGAGAAASSHLGCAHGAPPATPASSSRDRPGRRRGTEATSRMLEPPATACRLTGPLVQLLG